jgi:uncharacterized membrane protein YbhN (UPF0104 family)
VLKNGWVRSASKFALFGVFGYLILSLLRRVDWGSVGSALAHLAWWQLLVLVGLLLARRFLDALPLTFYIPDLLARHALQNDLSAALIAIAAPPPSDMVLRVSMFKSWGVEVSRGLSGAIMNMTSFYVARFAAPVVGLVLLAVAGGLSGGEVATAGLSLLVSMAIIGSLVLVLRGEEWAVKLGRFFGSLVKRVRHSVDPENWARSFVEFRSNMTAKAQRGLPKAIPVLLVMIALDGTILLMALRFTGVPSSAVPVLLLLGTYMLSYPLTLFPFSGIGVFDAVLIAFLVESAGEGFEPEIMAGLLVWRVITILGPVIMGVVALGLWRRAGHTWDKSGTVALGSAPDSE